MKLLGQRSWLRNTNHNQVNNLRHKFISLFFFQTSVLAHFVYNCSLMKLKPGFSIRYMYTVSNQTHTTLITTFQYISYRKLYFISTFKDCDIQNLVTHQNHTKFDKKKISFLNQFICCNRKVNCNHSQLNIQHFNTGTITTKKNLHKEGTFFDNR